MGASPSGGDGNVGDAAGQVGGLSPAPLDPTNQQPAPTPADQTSQSFVSDFGSYAGENISAAAGAVGGIAMGIVNNASDLLRFGVQVADQGLSAIGLTGGAYSFEPAGALFQGAYANGDLAANQMVFGADMPFAPIDQWGDRIGPDPVQQYGEDVAAQVMWGPAYAAKKVVDDSAYAWDTNDAKPLAGDLGVLEAGLILSAPSFTGKLKLGDTAETGWPRPLTDYVDPDVTIQPTSASGIFGRKISDNGIDLAPKLGTLTTAEQAEIQAIADKYNTTIDVVGSRASGQGRNIETDFPVGKGLGTRSDIDFRIDTNHPQVDALMADLNKVSNGAGNASLKHGTDHRISYPPVISISPQ